MGDWVRANHAFHDLIYKAADLPLVEGSPGELQWGRGRDRFADVRDTVDKLRTRDCKTTSRKRGST